MNLRPSGYEPDELPGCSTPRQILLGYSPDSSNLWSRLCAGGRAAEAPRQETPKCPALKKCPPQNTGRHQKKTQETRFIQIVQTGSEDQAATYSPVP